MNGVTVLAQSRLEQLHLSDAVIVGSGMLTREVVKNPEIMQLLQEGLHPSKQLIGAQCSGTLILAQLGLLGQIPACTDLITKPWVQESGVNVLNTPFYAENNIATAGGCLASQYLAAWIIAKTQGLEAAKEAMHYVAPVGEKEEYVNRAIANINTFL
jgi:transcriptional regulator GlxA family with amidase domain